MDTAQVIQVIKTTLLRRGKGIEGDPIRVITQYWTLDGELLFEFDPCEHKTYVNDNKEGE